MVLKEAAEYLKRDPATLSRYESGVYPIQSPELLKLLDLYQVSEEHRRYTLLKLGDEAWQKGWWDGYSPDLADWFSDFIWLESRANRVQAFDNVVFPGLLQTEGYAEAAMRATAWDADDETIQRMLELRMTRKAVLRGSDPTALSIVLDEALIHRQAGSPTIFAAQLAYVASLAAEPNIEIMVLPFGAGLHPSHAGAFKIFTLPEPFPQVVHADSLHGGVYVEAPDSERWVEAYDRLRRLSLDPAASAELISAKAEELT